MTRGYFVEEKGKKIYGAKIKSDAYLSGIGRCIIEAFAKGEEKAYMKKLRQEMDEKQREDLEYLRHKGYSQIIQIDNENKQLKNLGIWICIKRESS